MGKNVIIFGINISSSMHIDNKKKNILVLRKCPTQGLDDTTLTVEDQHSINFSRLNKIFSLKLPHNGSNSLLMLEKYINLEQMILK